MMKCCFCASDAKRASDRAWTCARCGMFVISGPAESAIEHVKFDPAAIGGWIREQNEVGIIPRIVDQADLQRVNNLSRPDLRHRIERYLLTVANEFPALGMSFDPYSEKLIGASYSYDQQELEILVNYLVEEEFLKVRTPRAYWLIPKGHLEADVLRSKRAKASQGFVAMWFAPDMKPIYDDGLSVGIEGAGYKPMRVDQKEHANKIDDEIIAEIRRSAFVVADFTGHRGGVYFEAGFAMGLGLPVIWTCRNDHMKEIHFDIRQYNCIGWSDADGLATRLQQRIEAMLGHGPLSNHQQA